MNDLALSTIELFAGTAMLGEGVRAGLEYMGIAHRTVCYVEREAHAAGVLVARMEEGSLDAAPIWSDITTFPARRFRGKVDFVVAGFPCQDMSVAGRRDGLDGERSGLFFDTVDVAEACGARGMLLENVAGIFSANASVMDETDGFFFERACARVLGELSDRGWDAEWVTISASDVGASHGRARWFCLAWRMDDAERTERRSPCSSGTGGEQGHDSGRAKADGRPGIAKQVLADAARHVRDGIEDGQSGSRRRVCETGNALDNADRAGTQRSRGAELCFDAGREEVGDAPIIGCRQRWAEQSGRNGFTSPVQPSISMADANSAGLRTGGEREGQTCDAIPFNYAMADAGCTRSQGHEQQAAYRADGRTDGRTDGRKNHADQLPNFIMMNFSHRAPATLDGQQSSNEIPNSPRHLNPLFGAWLMGWPSTWVIAEPHASSALATASFRSALQSRLSLLLGEPEYLNKEAA